MTPIQISSNALIHVGDDPITAFDESDGGIACELLYPVAKDEILATHPWSFALKSQRLSMRSAEVDSMRYWTKSHQLPPDFVYIWKLLPEGMEYEIEGDVLFSNNEDILMQYVHSCDEALFSIGFQTALEYLLASKLALTVTEDKATHDTMRQLYMNQLGVAQNSDSQQRPCVPIQDAPFNHVRNGGRRGLY